MIPVFDLHTAVLLWLNDAGTHLRISELATSSDDIRDAPFLAGDGVLGAVIARRERVSLHDLKPSYKVPYYTGPCPVRALAASETLVVAGGTLWQILRKNPDAKKWFDAAGDACLFTIDVNVGPTSYVCDFYQSLDAKEPSRRFGVVDGDYPPTSGRCLGVVWVSDHPR